jgi:hypothetical protein
MNRQPHGKYRALPGSLIAVTSPPIMRASLRDNARPNPVPRCQRIGLGEVLDSFASCSAVSAPPSGQAHHTVIRSALPAQNRSWFSVRT